MNLFFIREFVVLADACNYMEAAERLFISQSTLSKNIQALEAELGVTLFDRSTRKVKLSPVGSLLLPYARKITQDYFAFEATARNYTEALNGKVIIYSIPVLPQYRITNVISRFQKKHLGFSIRTEANDPGNPYDALREGRCELAFIRRIQGTAMDADFVEIPFFTDDDLVAVLPRNHPLSSEEVVRLEQLHDETFVSLEESGMPYQLMLSVCQRTGFFPRISFTCSQVGSVLDLVTQGVGVALLLRGQTIRPSEGGFEERQPFVVKSLIPTIKTDINLCYVKNRPLSAAAEAFVSIATEHIQSSGALG